MKKKTTTVNSFTKVKEKFTPQEQVPLEKVKFTKENIIVPSTKRYYVFQVTYVDGVWKTVSTFENKKGLNTLSILWDKKTDKKYVTTYSYTKYHGKNKKIPTIKIENIHNQLGKPMMSFIEIPVFCKFAHEKIVGNLTDLTKFLNTLSTDMLEIQSKKDLVSLSSKYSMPTKYHRHNDLITHLNIKIKDTRTILDVSNKYQTLFDKFHTLETKLNKAKTLETKKSKEISKLDEEQRNYKKIKNLF